MKKIAPALGLIAVLGLVVLVGGGVYAYTQLQPVSSTVQPEVRFTVPKGQSVSAIANRLVEAGLIRNALLFRVELKRLNLDNKIQAGSFELAPSMTLTDIAQALTSGTNDLWVTIPEGWRREEIADSLERQDLEAFDKAAFLELSAASEGRLFPDTYLVPREVTAQTLYNLLTDTFERKITVGLGDEIDENPRTFDQVLIMASLLEREAVGYEQMRQVAGVLWNRIDAGMPLQVDATLQYAKGYNQAEQTWWATPLAADRQINSPFNTYQNPGLPPRPIANPGVDAVKAALDPAESDYLFYIHSDGQVYFARTLDEHNTNINRYLK